MRRGSSKRARVRGKEGDFFSSCKPFQLCSGLRTEAVKGKGEESLRSPHVSKAERRNCVALCFILTTESRQEKEGCGERAKGKGAYPGIVCCREGEDPACKAELGLELGGLSGTLPSGYSPTTHHSALLACLPACLAGPGSNPQPPSFLLSTPRCPLSLQPHPSRSMPAFDPRYQLSPGAADDPRIREKDSRIKERS